MADSPIERIRQLDREREELISGAKRDALARVNEALEQLNGLGFRYALVDQAGSGAKRQSRGGARGSRGSRGSVKDAECPICKFRTDPPHDARAHRGQGDSKRPFTAQQLKERGYSRAS